jgi:hypothetical protein
LRSNPEVGRPRGGAKNPKSPISTTFPKIAVSKRGQKSQKPYIHNLFLLSKIYNIFLGREKYKNWWKSQIQANALIKPVSDN